MPKMSSWTSHWESNFSWDKRSYIEYCSRKERSGIVLLLAGVWKYEGIIRNTDQGRFPFCLGEEGTEYTLLE